MAHENKQLFTHELIKRTKKYKIFYEEVKNQENPPEFNFNFDAKFQLGNVIYWTVHSENFNQPSDELLDSFAVISAKIKPIQVGLDDITISSNLEEFEVKQPKPIKPKTVKIVTFGNQPELPQFGKMSEMPFPKFPENEEFMARFEKLPEMPQFSKMPDLSQIGKQPEIPFPKFTENEDFMPKVDKMSLKPQKFQSPKMYNGNYSHQPGYINFQMKSQQMPQIWNTEESVSRESSPDL